VEVKFDGKLPDGYEVGSVTTSPAKVKLRGPSDRVSALQKVVTESVSLNDRKESFDLANVAVIVGDTKVEVIDPSVNLHVEIVQKKGTQNVQRPSISAAPLIASLNPHSMLMYPLKLR
jgi:YbbR domain-containing protein